MKKIICLILSLSIICTSMNFSCFADEKLSLKSTLSDNDQFCFADEKLDLKNTLSDNDQLCVADEKILVEDVPSCESVNNGQFCLPNKTLKKINSQLKVCKNDKSLTPEQVESCIAEVYKNLDLSKEENSVILLGLKCIKLLLKKGFNLSCGILKYGLGAALLCSWAVLGRVAKGVRYLLSCAARVPSAIIDIMTGFKPNKIDELKKENFSYSYLR